MAIPKNEQKILEEVKFLKDRYFTFDIPVNFDDKIMVYPISVRHYNDFMVANGCLLLNKNDDPVGVPMTHLDYLVYKMQEKGDGPLWCWRFSQLCELSFHVKNGLYCDHCGKFLSYDDYVARLEKAKEKGDTNFLNCDCGEGAYHEAIRYKLDEKTKKMSIIIRGVEITYKDFARLRKIILYQNLPDFKDDSWVHPAIRADQAAKAELQAKAHGKPTASLERQIICVCAKSPYKIEEIYDLPMRKFIALLGVVDDALNYEATRIGLATGLASPKGPIEHWVYRKERGLYDTAVDLASFKGQINKANGG